MIDHKLFELAQERMERNKVLAQRNRHMEYLLSGFFRCGMCGAVMAGAPCGSKHHRNYCYRCASHWSHVAEKTCVGVKRLIGVVMVDDKVWSWVRGILIDDKNIEDGLNQMIKERRMASDIQQERLELKRD